MSKREHYYNPIFGDWMITLGFLVIMATPIAGWFIMDEIYKHKKEIKQTEQTISKKKETKTMEPTLSDEQKENIKKAQELRQKRTERIVRDSAYRM